MIHGITILIVINLEKSFIHEIRENPTQLYRNTIRGFGVVVCWLTFIFIILSEIYGMFKFMVQ